MKKLLLSHLLFLIPYFLFSQNVGIGNVNPTMAGLVVDTKVGADHAIFGSNTTGVTIESSWPGIGFNTFYNNSRKAIATGYGGLIFVDPVNGGMGFYVTDASYNTGAVVTMNTAMTIKPNGNVGIGTTSPSSKLDVNGQVTIDQKNFGGNAGLLIKGNVPGNNYPNIGFSVTNSSNNDEVAATITGVLVNNSAGSESISLNFATSQSGIGGLADRMVISPNGNVGIGITAPGQKLTVVSADNSSLTNIGAFYPNNLTQGIGIGYDEIRKIGTNPSGDLYINAKGSGNLILQNSATGNVGIGTVTPASKLEINLDGASNYGTTMLLNQNAIGNSDGPKIQFRKTMTSTKSWTAGILNGVNVGSFSINEDGSTSGFGTPRVTITPGGYVGIGNTDPGYILDVSQRIRVRSNGVYSAGMWFNNTANIETAFLGMEDDTHIGIYGGGTGWKFSMNTNTGALKINDSEGSTGQVLKSNSTGGAAQWASIGTILPTYYLYNNMFGPNYTLVNSTGEFVLSNSTIIFSVPSNSRLIISANYAVYTNCINCFGSGRFYFKLDGNSTEINPVVVQTGVGYCSGSLPNFFYDVGPGLHTIIFFTRGELQSGAFNAYLVAATVVVMQQ